MAKPFEVKDEITVDATPEDVWQAVTSGPHIDSWFIGHTVELEPRAGGSVKTDFGGFVAESTVTAWEPGHRFAYRSAEAPDGSYMAFEYVIEARGGGRTAVRLVHSGFLADDNWETEYDALKKGDPFYLHTLGQYVTHFRGRSAVRNIFAPGPNVQDKDRVWSVLRSKLNLSANAAPGTPVKATLDGLSPVDGVVDFASPDFLGVRTQDGLLRLIHGYDGTVVAEHHIFSESVAQKETTEDWQKFLTAALA